MSMRKNTVVVMHDKDLRLNFVVTIYSSQLEFSCSKFHAHFLGIPYSSNFRGQIFLGVLRKFDDHHENL